MAFRARRHKVGGEDGTLQVRTDREGLAQTVGHDLIIDVGQCEAAVQIGEDGTLSAVRLEADPRSLQVHGGLHGIKPLTDLRGDAAVTRSEWGIEPYRGMMGALKVRDTIEVILDVPPPSN